MSEESTTCEPDESVLAIPAIKLWNFIPYKEQGLINGDSDILNSIIQNGLFLKRNKLEEDPSFKQIIPYAIISCKDSFYLFKRTTGQVEKRLHNLYSFGAGGHMNPGNQMNDGDHYIIDELMRELSEEVELLNGCYIENIEFIGFINDDTIPVGTVHIGLLYNIRVSDKDLYINEPEKMTGTWIEKTGLSEFYDGMETWTKIIYDDYIR